MSPWTDEPTTPTTAAEHADAGTRAWETATEKQTWSPSRHEDFYAIAGEITQTLRALDGMAVALTRQTENYGTNREVYDDSRNTDEEVNPYTRLGMAVEHLEQMRTHLDAAHREANDYWSAIGHIGVEYHDTAHTSGDGETETDEEWDW